MITPLILAALISSPSIGEIYTLPPWMPTSVDARHTPGSYPATSYPARVTAETYAAYAAIDEAILERAYYLCAGNMEDYGYSKNLGDINPRELHYNAVRSVYDSRAVVTNLVKSASTRLLQPAARLWATNLWGANNRDGLAMVLRHCDGFSFARTNGYRRSTRTLHRVFPASTLIEDLTPSFPMWSWTTNDLDAAVGQWLDHGATFFNFAGDPISPGNPWMFSEPAVMPHASGVSPGYYSIYGFEHLPVTTFVDMLAGNLPFVNYLAITNTSSRLLWERAAAASEILAAVDRSYCDTGSSDDPDGIYCGNAEIDATITKIYEADLDTSGVYLSSDGTVGGYSRSPSLSWDLASNRVEVVSNAWSDTTLVLQVKPDSLGATGGQKTIAPCGEWHLDVPAILADAPPPPDFTGTVRFDIDSWGQHAGDPLTIDCDITATTDGQGATSWTVKESATADFSPPSSITLLRYGKLDAVWTEPVIPSVSELRSQNALLYPSWRAFTTGRVKEVELACVAYFWEEILPDYISTNREWCCAREVFETENQGLYFVRRQLVAWAGHMRDYATARGIPAPSVEAASARLDGAIGEAVESVTLSLATIVQTNLSFEVEYASGQPVNPPATFPLGGLGLEATVEFTLPSDPTGLVTNGIRCVVGDQSQYYRVDWDWHALRLDQSE